MDAGRKGTLTEVSRVVVHRALETSLREERDQVLSATLVYAMSGGQAINSVKHFEDERARLVDSADDGPPLLRQHLQDRYALGA